MAIETERRPSGCWTVIYQPDIPPNTIDKFQGIFTLLGNDIVTEGRFNLMAANYIACFLATRQYSLVTSSNYFNNCFGFRINNDAVLFFKKEVDAPRASALQSAQFVLRLLVNDVDFPFAVFDAACYLYGIPYKSMPIVVGNNHFIERVMSEIYTNATGKPVETRLVIY